MSAGAGAASGGATRHQWHLPDPSFTPIAPFTTHQSKNAATRTTAIVTDRIVDYNKQSTTWSIVDFSERYRPELDDMMRHKEQQKAAMHRIDSAMRREQAARHREAQLRDAQPKCIPALSGGGGSPIPPERNASIWQRMSRLCAADERDEAFWLPRQRGGQSLLHGDEAVQRRWEAASHDGSGDEGDGTASPNVQRVKRQLQSHLTVTQNTRHLKDAAGSGTPYRGTLGPAATTNDRFTTPPTARRDLSRMERGGAAHLAAMPLAQSIPLTLIRLHGLEASVPTDEFSDTGGAQASPLADLLANPSELLPRLDFGPAAQEMLEELLTRGPRPLLQCYDDASLVERFATLEIVDPYRMLAARKGGGAHAVGEGPSVFHSAATHNAAKMGPRAYFSVLAGRDRRSSPVLTRLALDQLVDVTLGCGFSPSLSQHLRSMEDADRCRSMRLEKHDEDAMVRRVQLFVKQNRPKPFKATASAQDKEAQRRAVGLFCHSLEQAFPILVGPPVSFVQRLLIPSNRCFSVWFLSDDAGTATALHFAVEDEREGALWVSTLRALLRLNDRARVASVVGASGAPAEATGVQQPLQSIRKALEIPTSLEERRWACHCIVDEQQRRMERGEVSVAVTGAVGSGGSGLGFVFKSALRDMLAQDRSKYDPPSEDTVV